MNSKTNTYKPGHGGYVRGPDYEEQLIDDLKEVLSGGGAGKIFNIYAPHYTSQISPNTIDRGTRLLVHPKFGSHTNEPYIVRVIFSCNVGFITQLETETHGCIRQFRYDAPEWEYHKYRFEILND